MATLLSWDREPPDLSSTSILGRCARAEDAYTTVTGRALLLSLFASYSPSPESVAPFATENVVQ